MSPAKFNVVVVWLLQFNHVGRSQFFSLPTRTFLGSKPVLHFFFRNLHFNLCKHHRLVVILFLWSTYKLLYMDSLFVYFCMFKSVGNTVISIIYFKIYQNNLKIQKKIKNFQKQSRHHLHLHLIWYPNGPWCFSICLSVKPGWQHFRLGAMNLMTLWFYSESNPLN